MRFRALVAVFVCLLVVPFVTLSAQAATGAITTVTLQVFANGVDPATGTPIQSSTAAFSLVACNVAKPTLPAPGTVVVQPKTIIWDDPVNVGKACTLDRSAFFGGLPVGTYRAAVTLTNDVNLTSPRGVAADPFVGGAVTVPPTPANVRLSGS